MPVESAADRAAFVNADEFGVVGTYTQEGAAPVAVSGILDSPSGEVLGSPDSAGVLTDTPRFLVREADLPQDAGEGDTLLFGGTLYSVVSVAPDGTGMAEIALERAS